MSSSPASHPIAFSAASSPYSTASCADAHDTMTNSYSYPNPTATAGVYSNPPELVYPGEDGEHQQMYTAPSYSSMASSQPPTWSTSPLAKKQQLAMSQQYTQQQAHHPAYASAGHHHSQQSSSPVPSPVPQDFSDDWQRTAAGSYQLGVQQQATSQSGYRIKTEDQQPSVYASGYSRPVYDMSGHFHSSQHQQPQYSPAGVMPGYYQLSHQPGAHERYIHPADLSPVEQHYPMSPLRVGHSPSQPGCDPRYVSGDIGAAHDIDRRHELDADGDEDSVDQETFEETTTASDTHEEDYEDVDYDDDRDGDFVLRRSRVSNSARRSLRPRSNPDRYAPYSYPVDTFGAANPLGITTRTRRTISNATDSSAGSSASSSSAYPPPPLQGVRRRARSSASLPAPVPVPNLTKKSRGRRVPTVSVLDAKRDAEFRSSSKGARVHTCKVPGCGKCFARGEHLKRHVRSIHTYEKPHKCPYPGCGKDFSRHDNLGQHMRVHKDYRP